MAQFNIKDPQTGKTVTVEGNSAPNPSEYDQIFQQAGLRNKSIIQQASGVAKNLGLGAVPDILGSGQFAIQKLLAGKNPFSAEGETPQQLQQETAGNQFINPQQTGGATQAGQDLAGAASWMVPESKIGEGATGLGKGLSFLLNKGGQGAIQGGLNAASQGQDIVGGAETGAVANPLLSGAGKVLTSGLPRYIGWRNFGKGGALLPEVTKAENAAGGNTLEQVRQNAINQYIKPWEKTTNNGLHSELGSKSKSDLLDQIETLAQKNNLKGTPGLGTQDPLYPTNDGALGEVKSIINKSTDPADAFFKITNAAYPRANTPVYTKLSSFMTQAAAIARDHAINTSENPAVVRDAFNNYANQTAMSVGGKTGKGFSDAVNYLKNTGVGETGLVGGLALLGGMLPALSAGVPLLAADTALTNRLTGPPLARGLVNLGENQPFGAILKRLGISGAQGMVNASQNQ